MSFHILDPHLHSVKLLDYDNNGLQATWNYDYAEFVEHKPSPYTLRFEQPPTQPEINPVKSKESPRFTSKPVTEASTSRKSTARSNTSALVNQTPSEIPSQPTTAINKPESNSNAEHNNSNINATRKSAVQKSRPNSPSRNFIEYNKILIAVKQREREQSQQQTLTRAQRARLEKDRQQRKEERRLKKLEDGWYNRVTPAYEQVLQPYDALYANDCPIIYSPLFTRTIRSTMGDRIPPEMMKTIAQRRSILKESHDEAVESMQQSKVRPTSATWKRLSTVARPLDVDDPHDAAERLEKQKQEEKKQLEKQKLQAYKMGMMDIMLALRPQTSPSYSNRTKEGKKDSRQNKSSKQYHNDHRKPVIVDDTRRPQTSLQNHARPASPHSLPDNHFDKYDTVSIIAEPNIFGGASRPPSAVSNSSLLATTPGRRSMSTRNFTPSRTHSASSTSRKKTNQLITLEPTLKDDPSTQSILNEIEQSVSEYPSELFPDNDLKQQILSITPTPPNELKTKLISLESTGTKEADPKQIVEDGNILDQVNNETGNKSHATTAGNSSSSSSWLLSKELDDCDDVLSVKSEGSDGMSEGVYDDERPCPPLFTKEAKEALEKEYTRVAQKVRALWTVLHVPLRERVHIVRQTQKNSSTPYAHQQNDGLTEPPLSYSLYLQLCEHEHTLSSLLEKKAHAARLIILHRLFVNQFASALAELKIEISEEPSTYILTASNNKLTPIGTIYRRVERSWSEAQQALKEWTSSSSFASSCMFTDGVDEQEALQRQRSEYERLVLELDQLNKQNLNSYG